MPHVVNCIAFYSLDFTNICFKYHERKKPVHTFCTPIFHGILKCDKVCSCIAALHHLLVLGPHFYAKCGDEGGGDSQISNGAVAEVHSAVIQPTGGNGPKNLDHCSRQTMQGLFLLFVPFSPLCSFFLWCCRFYQFWSQSDAHVLSWTFLSLDHKTSG